MIISKTPLRISFAGGGSDIESYYRKSAGAVVSTSIDKYVYITVNKKFDDHIRVSYSKTEEVKRVDEVGHKLVREILKFHKIKGGLEITSIADIPSRGTGMGSSSSFSVGLLHCLYAYKNKYVSAARLAEESSYIEINKCGGPIGKQDQYSAAFGGFNFIQFNTDGSVKVEPLIFKRKTKELLKKNLLLFYTGITRSASSILIKQVNNISISIEKRNILEDMVTLAYKLKADLQDNRLDTFGDILHQNWILKKELSDDISNPQIDVWYDIALKNGAAGGKLLGAGGGGFLLFSLLEKNTAR